MSLLQTNPLAVSDALQGLLSRLRWNKPPKGFEKFFKDKPSTAPKQEPAPPTKSAPKEARPKSSGASSEPSPKAAPKGGSQPQPDFSKFFKNSSKPGGIGGSDGDKQRYATMAAFGTGALLLFFLANQMAYKEITWKEFVKAYLAKGSVVRYGIQRSS